MSMPPQSRRRAAAIPLAALAVMMLLAMGVALPGLGLNSRLYSPRTASNITEQCAVDSGLSMALFEMNKKLKVNIEIIRFGRD